METLFIGRNLIFLPEINSTNSYATDLLKNVNLPEGTVIHTAHQTQGKGQRGSVWKAEPASNLIASLILKPSFLEIKKQFVLYQIFALASYDTLAEILNTSQFDIKIKWPNDILVDGKKICGILIENNVQNNRFNWSVAGVGMNINQLQFEKGIHATSAKLLTGQVFDVKRSLELLCKHVEKYYLLLKNGHFSLIQKDYLQRLYGLNTWLNFERSGIVEPLLVEGISETGLLSLQSKDGHRWNVDVKEVKWL